jgi:hypothetical protein
MGLRKRFSRASTSGSPRAGREPGADWLSAAVRAFVGGLTELLKLGREMLVIPLQLWLFAAENAGAAVLAAWRRVVVPIARLAWGITVALYATALRHVTPVRALAAVAAAALVALAASQWLDLSSISVGNDAYAPGVQTIAPPPDVSAESAGEAHAWIMIPIALAGLAALAAGLTGRPGATRLLIVAGIAAIAVSVAIDAPEGLDEGSAAIAYEGAEARLLEGFWLQIACGAVLIATGLLLPLHLRSSGAWSARRQVRPAGSSRARRWRLAEGPRA